MAERETRRINPIAHITLVLVVAVLLLQAFVIFGGLELRAQTVQKYAPWAHEAFLKMVGEHPGFKPNWIEEEKPTVQESSVSDLAGLVPAAIPQLMETNGVITSSTNQLLVPTVPLEAEEAPVLAPTNSPMAEEVVPVG